MPTSRRSLLRGFAGVAIAAGISPRAMWAGSPVGIRFGYAAMTWGKDERQAVEDISSTGFEGIQFRIDATAEFQPAQLRDLLGRRRLTFVALSSGEISLDPTERAAALAKHTENARFVKAAGGLYLQILDRLKTYPRTVTAAECKQLGALLTELGRRTADAGVPLAYHNHMNTIGQRPEHLDMVMEASDPRYVKLLLDTAHSVAGGGDPAAAIVKYHQRILFVHLKDVVDIPADTPGAKYPFQWVELGRGRADLPAVFAALERVRFAGWAVVELDRVPVASRTPRESALISRKYLQEKIGVRFAGSA